MRNKYQDNKTVDIMYKKEAWKSIYKIIEALRKSQSDSEER